MGIGEIRLSGAKRPDCDGGRGTLFQKSCVWLVRHQHLTQWLTVSFVILKLVAEGGNGFNSNRKASTYWLSPKKEQIVKIRKSSALDGAEIEKIHIKAFGKDKGPEIADLVSGLFNDKTASPLLSLIAVEGDQLIGHILFTKATFTQTTEPASTQILAPLAVLPDVQRKGVGGQLIEEGLIRLIETGVELVFVLGHPDYYPRYGFIPAGNKGYEAPYPIPEEHAGAWMVQELSAGVIGRITGKVRCCDLLNQPEHWRE